MTVKEFQSALKITDQQVEELRTIARVLAKFDKELARSSASAHELASETCDEQFQRCCEWIANLLGLPIQEVEKLISSLLDYPMEARITHTLNFSRIIEKLHGKPTI